MTERKFYHNLPDLISNGKYCVMNNCSFIITLNMSCQWVWVCVCVCVCVCACARGKNRVEYRGVCATCAEHHEVMKYFEKEGFISIYPVTSTVTLGGRFHPFIGHEGP